MHGPSCARVLGSRSARRWDRVQICPIDVTPRPSFARLDRAYERVTRRLEMGSRVSSRRAVATSHRAARQALSEMDPPTTEAIAGRAAPRPSRECPHVDDMRAVPMRQRALERQPAEGVGQDVVHVTRSGSSR
jgi:hypothetical protein